MILVDGAILGALRINKEPLCVFQLKEEVSVDLGLSLDDFTATSSSSILLDLVGAEENELSLLLLLLVAVCLFGLKLWMVICILVSKKMSLSIEETLLHSNLSIPQPFFVRIMSWSTDARHSKCFNSIFHTKRFHLFEAFL